MAAPDIRLGQALLLRHQQNAGGNGLNHKPPGNERSSANTAVRRCPVVWGSKDWFEPRAAVRER